MWRNKGAASFDYLSSINLECVGNVIAWDLESVTDCRVDNPVSDEFCFRIIDYLAVRQKATAENAFVTLLQFPPIAYKILRGVGQVGHHNGNGVSGKFLKSQSNCSTKSILAIVCYGHQRRNILAELGQDALRRVGATVINHKDFMDDILLFQLPVNPSNASWQIICLVACRNDYGKLCQDVPFELGSKVIRIATESLASG